MIAQLFAPGRKAGPIPHYGIYNGYNGYKIYRFDNLK